MSDEPIFSILEGKTPHPLNANLWSCQNNTCSETTGNLCFLNPTNACPNENYNNCNQNQSIYANYMGSNESGDVPAVLVCCTDVGYADYYSQAFLDEQDWTLFWCANYGETCGYMPVNDYNRCQYLMSQYSPSESGDYCDRIDLYTNNAYDVLEIPGICS